MAGESSIGKRGRATRRQIVVRILLAGFGVLGVALILIGVFVVRSVGPSPECARPTDAPVEPGSTTARHVSSGTERRCYLLHVPASYRPDTPMPVVMTLHGFAGNASQIQGVSHWDEVGEREGFVTIYPDGAGFPLRWNSDPISLVRVDDVQFIRDIIAHVSTLVNVDRTRIYVNGFSNGGGMSIVTACRAADLVAAVGAIETGGLSADTVETCQPSRPVPLIEFDGRGDSGPLFGEDSGEPVQEDRTDPLLAWLLNVSAEPVRVLSSEVRAARWAELNDCAAPPEDQPGEVQRIRYGQCSTGAQVVLYIISGMGHQWPGGESQPLLGETSEAIDASETMWQFFETYHG